MTNLTPTVKTNGINITCTPELSEPGAVFAAVYTMKITRRDGFYEATGNGRYFQIARLGRRWELKECFGGAAGWGESDHFDTFRDAKEEAAFRISLSEES